MYPLSAALVKMSDALDEGGGTPEDIFTAALNILEDFNSEKAALEDAQRATLNILEDFEAEKAKVELVNQTLGTEIAERKQAEERIRRLNEELENANLAKDRFLAGMSHELRTPLNAIIGFTGTLLMKLPGPLTPDQDKQLRTVQTSARHLLSLINDLLDLAKIESGTVELNLEPVRCQSVLDEVTAALAPMAAAKGLRLLGAVPLPDLLVRTDRRALSQILLNLVNNAIKFTDTGEVGVALSQRRGANGTVTEISVTDTGVGIRPKDQTRLFQAFEQVSSAEMRRREGTGLGLYLSQKLAGLLGGRIEFESEYGHGSLFRLVIEEG